MKNKIIIAGFLIALFISGFYYLKITSKDRLPFQNTLKQTPVSDLPKTNNKDSEISIVAENLDTPWAIAILPDGGMLVTERSGQVRLITSNGQLDPKPVAVFNQVKEIGEGGFLGIALHPDFSSNHYVYFYYTYSGNGINTFNRVARMTYEYSKFENEQIIVDRIPGASNHNGGRIKFGPDKNLYITTGDAQNPSQAQNINSLSGKILRVTGEGKSVSGNPFGNLAYSYGHRNPQGIAWDSQGRLWATEHGRSGVLSGLDELNLIESGKNYGWPTIQGDEIRQGMETPKLNSGSSVTWAPSGASFVASSLFFAGLRGKTFYEAVIQNSQVVELKEHLTGQYGRLREVVVGPDGMLYITTSNRDGRGNPNSGDDKIIRVNPQKL